MTIRKWHNVIIVDDGDVYVISKHIFRSMAVSASTRAERSARRVAPRLYYKYRTKFTVIPHDHLIENRVAINGY